MQNVNGLNLNKKRSTPLGPEPGTPIGRAKAYRTGGSWF